MVLSNVFENTISIALNALIVHDRSDASSAEQMMEAGVTDALLDLLLRSHVWEESSGRLLEALFNNVRVQGMKVSKYAIAPLSLHLLDLQTRSLSKYEGICILSALALGDLSQHEGNARSSD